MNERFQKLEKEIGRGNCQLKLSRVIQYLKDREKEEGGFSFVPRAPMKTGEVS
jgi:hypothetical protein